MQKEKVHNISLPHNRKNTFEHNQQSRIKNDFLFKSSWEKKTLAKMTSKLTKLVETCVNDSLKSFIARVCISFPEMKETELLSLWNFEDPFEKTGCQFKLLRGPRMGLQCGANVTKDSEFCSTHVKKPESTIFSLEKFGSKFLHKETGFLLMNADKIVYARLVGNKENPLTEKDAPDLEKFGFTRDSKATESVKESANEVSTDDDMPPPPKAKTKPVVPSKSKDISFSDVPPLPAKVVSKIVVESESEEEDDDDVPVSKPKGVLNSLVVKTNPPKVPVSSKPPTPIEPKKPLSKPVEKDSNSDDEEVPPPIKTPPKSVLATKPVEKDSESEEDVPPPTKTPPKSVLATKPPLPKPVEKDSESEEDVPPPAKTPSKPVVATKPPLKSVPAPAPSPQDSDSEEDDTPVLTKSTKLPVKNPPVVSKTPSKPTEELVPKPKPTPKPSMTKPTPTPTPILVKVTKKEVEKPVAELDDDQLNAELANVRRSLGGSDDEDDNDYGEDEEEESDDE